MNTTRLAAVVIAALVAGFALGSFGIASAGNQVGVAPAASAAANANAACSGECDTCTMAVCPPGAGANTAAGDCGSCEPAAANGAPAAGCPGGTGAAEGACGSCP